LPVQAGCAWCVRFIRLDYFLGLPCLCKLAVHGACVSFVWIIFWACLACASWLCMVRAFHSFGLFR
jgi:hypothetical protein